MTPDEATIEVRVLRMDEAGLTDESAAGRLLTQAFGGEGACNLSHSAPFVAVAFGEALGLGIDVEVLRPLPRPQAFARRIAAAGEAGLAADDLILLWTAKEAALKAMGVGLHGDPRAWAFDGLETATPRLVRCPAEAGPPEGWRFAMVKLRRPDAVLTVAARFAAPGRLRLGLQHVRRQDVAGEWRAEPSSRTAINRRVPVGVKS